MSHPHLCGDWEEAPHQNFQNLENYCVNGGGGYFQQQPHAKLGESRVLPVMPIHLNQNTRGTTI